jgi:hypothetical protein
LLARRQPKLFFATPAVRKARALPGPQWQAADFRFIHGAAAEKWSKFDLNIARRSPGHDFNEAGLSKERGFSVLI